MCLPNTARRCWFGRGASSCAHGGLRYGAIFKCTQLILPHLSRQILFFLGLSCSEQQRTILCNYRNSVSLWLTQCRHMVCFLLMRCSHGPRHWVSRLTISIRMSPTREGSGLQLLVYAVMRGKSDVMLVRFLRFGIFNTLKLYIGRSTDGTSCTVGNLH